MYEKMTQEQRDLLYELAEWYCKQFHNEMVDSWTFNEYQVGRECNTKIAELENKHRELYGELPEWKSMEHVWAAKKEMRKYMNKEDNQ